MLKRRQSWERCRLNIIFFIWKTFVKNFQRTHLKWGPELYKIFVNCQLFWIISTIFDNERIQKKFFFNFYMNTYLCSKSEVIRTYVIAIFGLRIAGLYFIEFLNHNYLVTIEYMILKFWTFILSMILDSTCKNGGNPKPEWSQLTHSRDSLVCNGS